jgi:integrase
VGELRSEEIAAWRIALSPGYRFDATQALRQVLARAVVWGMIDVNPAKLGVDNPSPRRREQRPFESWAELDAVAGNLSPRYRPMVIFAAATGLRPGEWLALEWRDIDLEARVVYVHRSFTKGRLKCPKTEASRRAVPLQTIALEAIERQSVSRDSGLVFPAERGGYFDLHNFRNREWKSAQVAAGVEPLSTSSAPNNVHGGRWWTLRGHQSPQPPPTETTKPPAEQAKTLSPLTDSNRRPPPYHSCKSVVSSVSRVSARDRACSR